ncbi:MAG: hypothetical protein GX050_09560 [Firmicutes bacterium]|nr:hypothetical protein [Bacillota bacterium]
MDDKRFGLENNEHEKSELERYLDNTAKFQTVNYPQQFSTNDPWAGWYNSSIDLGAKWEEYYAQLEKMKSPELYGTNYPVYEEPPAELDPAQFINNEPPGEGTYPFTPAPEEVTSDPSVASYPPQEEETPIQPTADEAPLQLEPETSEDEVAVEETKDQTIEAQATDEQLKEEQTTDEQMNGQQTSTEENTKLMPQEEKEESVTTSQRIIVWKNFPPEK